MWIRSAFWIGSPKAGAEAAFARAINEEMVPAFKALPGVRDAQALWPRRLEHEPPAMHCQFLVHYASLADMDRMLASPERLALRSRVVELVALFDGAISHIDYEVA